MRMTGPEFHAADQSEAVLRSLPEWFGIESSLLEYVQASTELPTFGAWEGETLQGFVTLRRHFEHSWELHCIAVRRTARGEGLGRRLVETAEDWLRPQETKFLQVKTIAASSPNAEYAQTRVFYERMGFVPLEEFPLLWSVRNPCLQLVKTV